MHGKLIFVKMLFTCHCNLGHALSPVLTVLNLFVVGPSFWVVKKHENWRARFSKSSIHLLTSFEWQYAALLFDLKKRIIEKRLTLLSFALARPDSGAHFR